MQTRLPVALLFALSACDKTVVTPPGTVVLDVPAIAKLSVSDWSVGAAKGAATKVEKKYHYTGGATGHDVRLKVSFEYGPLEFKSTSPKPGQPETVPAPRALRVEVLENDQWAITGRCEDSLAVPLAVNPDGTSAYPKDLWARCMVVMKRKNGDITTAPQLEIHGDGKISLLAIGSEEKVAEE